LAFQQVQKYEAGTNRISASMLHRIAEVLDVPVSFFFDDMPEDIRLVPGRADDILRRPDSLELLRNYHRLPEELRGQVQKLVRAMARNGAGPEE
jgi:transcriptional regulator with XRE-family HTH domain